MDYEDQGYPAGEYLCWGSVRGSCGVRHASGEAALRHCQQDNQDVKRGNSRDAYSDRSPTPYDRTWPSYPAAVEPAVDDEGYRVGAYACWGSVRGQCGVRHRTRDAALRHCEQDDRDVKLGNGGNAYSDRSPVPYDDL